MGEIAATGLFLAFSAYQLVSLSLLEFFKEKAAAGNGKETVLAHAYALLLLFNSLIQFVLPRNLMLTGT